MLDDWAGDRGERWLRDVDVMEAMLAPIGEAALARAGHVAGERVLDVGCGAGWTTLRAGASVGAGGLALGLDISPALVAEAARRAVGVPQVLFEAGDAATASPVHAPFDRLFSRFGVMFFPDPAAAFAHMARFLVPGARVDLAVWASSEWNPWMTELRRVVSAHVPLPSPEPLAPGPFQLADPDFHQPMLEGAGFCDVARGLLELPLLLSGPGATPAQAAAFALRAFSAGQAAAGAGAGVLAAATADLEQLYADHVTADGVAMQASVWLISARKA